MIKPSRILLFLIFLSLNGFSQGAAETALVPLLASGGVPGGYGTIWDTIFFASNVSSETLALREGHIYGCRIALCVDRTIEIEPGATVNLYTGFFHPNPRGRLFHFDADRGDDVVFRLELRERSSGEKVEIPVVRENNLKAGRIVLPRVDLRSDARLAVRIYTPLARGTGLARIRVTEAIATPGAIIPGGLLLQTVLPISWQEEIGQDVQNISPWAEILDLRSLLPGGYTGLADIEIEVDGRAVWAFATSTDVVTQDVLVYSPN